MKKIVLLIMALMTAACFAGCGNGNSDTSNDNAATDNLSECTSFTGIIEPEQLISKETAETLVGNALQEGEKSEQEVVGQKIIFYAPADEDDLDALYFQISLTQEAFMPSDSVNTPTSIYETFEDVEIDAGTLEPVEGIGERAMFFTPGIYILTHGYHIVIAVGNSDDPQVREILKEAGALAVQNLEQIVNP